MNYKIIISILLITIASFSQKNMIIHNVDGTKSFYNTADIDSITFYSIPTNGLLAYYLFDGNASDRSGNGHDGTGADISYVADRFGNENSACSFNGTSSVITIPDHDDLDLVDSFTICGWYYTESDQSNMCVIGKGRSATGGSYNFIVNTNGNNEQVGAGLHNGSENVTTTCNGVTSGEWHFFTSVYTGSMLKLYVDGEYKDQRLISQELIDSTEPLLIGNETISLERWFNGACDDISIYHRVLTETEISDMYSVK